VDNNIERKNNRKKKENEIIVKVKDEKIFWDKALKYHNFYRKEQVEEYWNEFNLIKAY
jgi:peptide methionine sulfoxide reductase MsrA